MKRALILGAQVALLALLGACSGQPENQQSVQTADAEGHSCTESLVTGSLVQKHVSCTSSDTNRNGVSDSMQNMSRPHGGSGGS